MTKLLINTGTASYNDLISKGRTFSVPPYQSDYSWEREYWEDLWLDILDLPKEKYHYMGYLVFQEDSTKTKTSFIIDGQQRFTTLSILCLSAIRLLKDWADSGIDKENNEIRMVKLTEKFLGNFSTSKLTITPKLVLNPHCASTRWNACIHKAVGLSEFLFVYYRFYFGEGSLLDAKGVKQLL